MRKLITGLTVMLIFVLTAYNACVKDTCSAISCMNGGVCVDAACACKRGYEGYKCEKRWTDKFTGNWQATDIYYSDTARHMYGMQVVTINNNLDTFNISGFSDTISVLCKRDSLYRFSFVPEQQIKDSVYVIKSGYGRLDISTGKVIGIYVVKLGDTTITTNFSWTR